MSALRAAIAQYGFLGIVLIGLTASAQGQETAKLGALVVAPVPAAPPGFISFCLRFPDQCRAKPWAAVSVKLTDDNWRTMQLVNLTVNESIWPEDDQKHYGRAEYWTIASDGYGDRDDYALTKRKELMEERFPEPALRVFVMFLVAEVHPFMDGNGRMARVMMNAELIAERQTRIFIPFVYRNEYVAALKLLTNYSDPSAFIRVMDYAQQFASRIDFADLHKANQRLEAHNAFRDPADDVKLKTPNTNLH